MRKTIYLSQLKELSILWTGDVYMLTEFMLRSYNITDRERNSQNQGTRVRSLPTLHGIASKFAILTGIPVIIVGWVEARNPTF